VATEWAVRSPFHSLLVYRTCPHTASSRIKVPSHKVNTVAGKKVAKYVRRLLRSGGIGLLLSSFAGARNSGREDKFLSVADLVAISQRARYCCLSV